MIHDHQYTLLENSKSLMPLQPLVDGRRNYVGKVLN